MIDDEAYKLSFSVKDTLNSAYFYFWWLMGAPELIQDYMFKPYAFLPRFFIDFGVLANLTIILSLLFFILIIINFLNSYKKIRKIVQLKKIFFSFLFMFFGILPVIFLPTHRFTIQLGLPMLGVAMFLAIILDAHKNRYLTIITLIIFVSFNFLSIRISQKSHYSITRANISEKVNDYFTVNYPHVESNTVFLIVNGQTEGHEIASWGSSRQLAFALWHENFVQAFYRDKTVSMKYEDLLDESLLQIEESKKMIYISAEEFLN